jgi:diketogulonate reductase-like aldo/keto reductase
MCQVIHWPVAFQPGGALTPVYADKPHQVILDLNTPLVETWTAMIALKKTGKVRQLP